MRDVRESVLDAALFRTAVQAAILAPSMHNYQPWRFRHADVGLEVSADPARQLTVADPRGWAARLACGAAAANASLALAAEGVPNRVELS
ncbi:MAG TPA: nitroreductase, partial [Rugosimonospora sp.]|nr:nitroreductase [Rugosimonospora sp.]